MEKSKQRKIEKMLQAVQKELEPSITAPSKEIQQRKTSLNANRREAIQSNKNYEKGGGIKATKRCSLVIERQHDSVFKKVRKESDTDSDLKYRCSFCIERFPSLTLVRDHTRDLHREENEHRREEKANRRNSTKKTSVEEKNVQTKSGTLNENQKGKQTLLFRCKSCKFASICYDRMIKHCQSHIIMSEDPQILILDDRKEPGFIINGEEFDVDMQTYYEIKIDFDLNNSYTFIYCDYELLKQDEWPGIFDDWPEHEINKINSTSIYYFTRIVCLTSRQKPSSAPFMLFQCEKCMKFIDPHCVLLHVQENSCNNQLADFPCYECKRPFLDENAMYLHYKTHKPATNSNMKYRTVFFNNRNNDLFNANLLKAAGLHVQNVQSKSFAQRLGQVPIKLKNSPLTNNSSKADELNMQNHSRFVQQRSASSDAKQEIELKNIPQTNNTQKATGLNMQKELSGSNGPQHVATAQVGVTSGSQTKDARTMIIKRTKNKTTSDIMRNVGDDKVSTVYKCQCELCFHEMDVLFKHLENCRSESVSNKISCICGLVFNEQQYQLHNGIHSQGFTKLNVKKVTVCHEKIIVLSNKSNGINNADTTNNIATINSKTNDKVCNEAISELVSSILNIATSLPYSEEKQILTTAATIRSVGSGTDYLNTSVMKSQETMNITEAHTAHEVNKDLVLKETNSVDSGTDDLNISVLNSQGIMTITEARIGHEINKDLVLQETKSVGSGTNDLNILNMESEEVITATDTEIVNEGSYNTKYAIPSKQAAIDASKHKEIVDNIKNNFYNQNVNLNSESENMEDNQSTVKTTIRAEIKEKSVIEKTKNHESVTYSCAVLENTGIIMMNEDHNKIINQGVGNQKQKATNTRNNQENDAIEINTEKKDEFQVTNEPGKDKDVVEPQQVTAESKEYTEDELLNGPVYFDAGEPILTDDEDPILIEDDDIFD